ncbi:MAG: FtsX-like permease family protein [Ilumatobacteraceae bacterium]
MRGASPGKLWSLRDLRARAVSLVVLGALAGLTIGLAAAAFDGARRTDTALDRLRARTNASDAVVFATQAEILNPDWSKLVKRPEVAHVIRWGLAFGNVDGDPDGVLFVPMDSVWLNTVDRPILVAGRMFDPYAPDEVVISDDIPAYDDGTPVEVGSTFPFTMLAGDIVDPQPGSPLEIRVVGIVHTPLSYVFTGGAFLSPGFVTRYGSTALVAENAVVQLRPGADIGALRRDVNTDVGEGVPVLDFRVTSRRVTATTDVEGAMLRLLAAIVLLAGVAFAGQALARSGATIGTDAPTLRAIGMTRRELVVSALRPHLVTAAVGVMITVLTAVVASRWFPVGLAATVDPSRGIQVNVALVTAAAVLTALVTLALVSFGSWRATRSSTGQPSRSSLWLAHLRIGRPVAVLVGARMAVEGGSGTRRKGSAWPALVGAAAAVTGVVAIVTVNHGLTDAVAHPQVAGVAWDASVIPLQDDVSITTGITSTLVDGLANEPGVAAVGTVARYVSRIGELGVPLFTVFEPDTMPAVQLVTLSGRLPQSDDEIVLGPSTARDLGVKRGDTVHLADGGSATVVGLGLFPSDVHAQFDEGGLVTPARWSQLAAKNYDPSTATLAMLVAVRFEDHDSVSAQIGALAEKFGPQVAAVSPVDQPAELANLHNVRTLPTVLAIFLAVLGAIAVGHALFSSVYRRRRDFAVMQSLGVTRRGVRAMIAAQATVVGVAGLIVGVPIGLIAGRASWQAITDRVPLTFRSPLTAIAILLVVPVALIAANLLAIIPARRAAKTKPALVLRSE